MRNLLQTLYYDFVNLSEEIDAMTQSVTILSQQNQRYEAIRNISDFGPILTAALISQVGAGNQLQNGRQFSAWCGLILKQNSTGGKVVLALYRKWQS